MFTFFRKKRSPQPLSLLYTNDMHSHILPGIDDGSQSVEESIELIEAMQQWGINRMIVTPHVTGGTFENTIESIHGSQAMLAKAMQERGVNMELSISAEYRIDDYFLEVLNDKKILPFPNGFLLVENSFLQPFLRLPDVLFDIQVKGHTPIMAHPERYPYYRRNDLEKLFHSGLYFQVNLLSFSGYYGAHSQEVAYWLLKEGMVSFIGTDLHNLGQIEVINKFLASKEYTALAQRARLKNDIVF